ncbi:unnamed protein product [Rotaria sp. Silwood2]|nr:unnamed protein product [Rotaria sp. Silwood2]CAF3437496.1 unnamed protein product [Rotaria sp. Silwood2]CAF4477640.1 unnamed protein product [Rotaria sp. Silwood2]CAF4545948.1 unnamed protein product [Rotaria sp. Silwood2]
MLKKEEDPNLSTHLYFKLFDADIRSCDVTDKVHDILHSNLYTFVRVRSVTANGLTLYKSVELDFIVDLTIELKNTCDHSKFEIFSLTSRLVLSFSLTFQGEISSLLTSIGETIQVIRRNFYKPNEKLFHINENFHLGDTTYSSKEYLERNDNHTHIELHYSMTLGYDFVYERKNNKENVQNNYNILSHLTLLTSTPNATVHSLLDLLILARSSPIQERIELEYIQRSFKIAHQTRQLISPEANLKIQVKSKLDASNFLIDS